jgi:hypothetical protein
MTPLPFLIPSSAQFTVIVNDWLWLTPPDVPVTTMV